MAKATVIRFIDSQQILEQVGLKESVMFTIATVTYSRLLHLVLPSIINMTTIYQMNKFKYIRRRILCTNYLMKLTCNLLLLE